jgi:hypothetical protein
LGAMSHYHQAKARGAFSVQLYGRTTLCNI